MFLPIYKGTSFILLHFHVFNKIYKGFSYFHTSHPCFSPCASSSFPLPPFSLFIVFILLFALLFVSFTGIFDPGGSTLQPIQKPVLVFVLVP